MPFLKCLLHASCEAVASIDRTAVWQNGAPIAVKALSGGGPASACYWRFAIRANRFRNPAPVTLRLDRTDHDFVADCFRTFFRAEGNKKGDALGRRRLLCVAKRLIFGERRRGYREQRD
jgi:hypothetical protein